MTSRQLNCTHCGSQFERSSARGPTPKYCSHSCRQRAYERRKTSELQASVAGISRSATAINELAKGTGVRAFQDQIAELSKTSRLLEDIAKGTGVRAFQDQIAEMSKTSRLLEDIAKGTGVRAFQDQIATASTHARRSSLREATRLIEMKWLQPTVVEMSGFSPTAIARLRSLDPAALLPSGSPMSSMLEAWSTTLRSTASAAEAFVPRLPPAMSPEHWTREIDVTYDRLRESIGHEPVDLLLGDNSGAPASREDAETEGWMLQLGAIAVAVIGIAWIADDGVGDVLASTAVYAAETGLLLARATLELYERADARVPSPNLMTWVLWAAAIAIRQRRSGD